MWFEDIKKFIASRYALVGAVLLVALIAIAVFGFVFSPTLAAIVTLLISIGVGATLIITLTKLSKTEGVEPLEDDDRLEAIFEHMREGVVVYSPTFTIQSINPAAEKLLGITKNMVEGKTIGPQSSQDPNLHTLAQIIFPSLAPEVDQLSETGWPQVVRLTTSNPEMKVITVLSRITDPQGNARGFVKIIQDISREEELLEAKTEFVTTVAHQLRTPLTGINWAFETLQNSDNTTNTKDIITQGSDLAVQALKILNDLLSVIQIEEGRFGYQFNQVNIADLVQEVVDQARPVAEQFHLTLTFNRPADTYMVRADVNRIKASFATLIDNAIRYNSEQGSVTISITPEDAMVVVSVTDTGVGIPQDEQASIFKKFYRGKQAAQLAPNGSGLGLYIVKNIVEKHGGSVSLESTPGRGSTFYISLPRA